MRRELLWCGVAVLPLLAVAAGLGVYHTANATGPANATAGTDCCLDPTCPPVARRRAPRTAS